MAGAASGTAFRHLRDLFGAGSVGGLGDGPLLARYSGSGDAAAFEALVARHGPMVLATCRAVLGNEHEVGDAFQATFLDDLADAKLAERVLLLCFSEFGRRVAENGSAGTDHGAAGPVLLAGPGVEPGLRGAYPSLTDLDDGDLRPVVDFRRVYATILEGWLGIPSRDALGGTFAPLALLKT